MSNIKRFLEMINEEMNGDFNERPHDCKKCDAECPIRVTSYVPPKPKVEVREVNDVYMLQLYVDKFIYDEKKITLVYRDLDGNKQTTNSICGNSDKYDRDTGENVCLLKALINESTKKLNSY